MQTLKNSSKRRIYSAYTVVSPLIGAAITVFSLIVLLAINAPAGAIMLILGVVLFIASASVWVFDKEGDTVARGLRFRSLYVPFWQRPLNEISVIEVMDAPDRKDAGTQMDGSSTVLVLRDGQRRSLWGEHSERSRELSKFLGVKVVETKAEA